MKIFDWNSEINDGQDNSLLDDGEYTFRVKCYEKQRTKKDGAPMAKVELEVEGREITDYLVLRENMEWKLAAFFRSVGLKKHGEPIHINFDGSIGRTGLCTIVTEEYTSDRNGRTYKSNRIGEYLDPKKDTNTFDDDFHLIDDDDEVPF